MDFQFKFICIALFTMHENSWCTRLYKFCKFWTQKKLRTVALSNQNKYIRDKKYIFSEKIQNAHKNQYK